jgi:hypothetical protein
MAAWLAFLHLLFQGIPGIGGLGLVHAQAASGVTVITSLGREGEFSTTLAISSTFNIAAHDTILAYTSITAAGCTAISTPTISTGDTFVLVGSKQLNQNTGGQCIALYIIKDASAGATATVTGVWDGSQDFNDIIVYQLRGANNTTNPDTTAIRDGSAGAGTAATSDSFTPSAANSVLVYGVQSSNTTTWTAGSCAGGTCTIGNTQLRMGSEYFSNPATSSTTASITLGTSRENNGIVAVIKP